MGLVDRLKGISLANLRGWPPAAEDFANGKWGFWIWDTTKGDLKESDGDTPSDECRYLQHVLARFNAYRGPCHGVYDVATADNVQSFQLRYKLTVDRWVGPKTWAIVDWVAFDTIWRQYRSNVNKYSGLPVDNHGLTRETSFVECLVRGNFPQFRFGRNWMVDRKARGQTFLSEHAYGNALDLMFGRNFKGGTLVAEWLGSLQELLGLRQVIYNTRICERGRWRKLLPKSLQHYDHIHVTCNSGRRPKVIKLSV